jgi:hypothetical protein
MDSMTPPRHADPAGMGVGGVENLAWTVEMRHNYGAYGNYTTGGSLAPRALNKYNIPVMRSLRYLLLP